MVVFDSHSMQHLSFVLLDQVCSQVSALCVHQTNLKLSIITLGSTLEAHFSFILSIKFPILFIFMVVILKYLHL